ncbi:hypothetical protein G3R49_11995 [Shewanella sp. WXL01]|uniref:Uncharacterized protein n=1 Tax=Shewanella maritima TaxID=2520507 RepID=A0A411PJ29_9GAMM|nr:MULTISPECIES: hypothetical protein [Shewanella]NKF51277.1 hypothetical protein [Shewanella sp. WXL01]QBF83586.1 hypothetical protein EXU30_13445 [Shewanella maritima]
MKIPLIISLVCIAVFLGLIMGGAHTVYVAYGDTITGQYAVAGLICIMWGALIAAFVSPFVPKLLRSYKEG